METEFNPVARHDPAGHPPPPTFSMPLASAPGLPVGGARAPLR